MKKYIREVDEKKGIMQVTILDERFYSKSVTDETTGLPVFKYYPSISWIAGFYPKGVEFYKWLAAKGWDEAENIKTTAGDKGTKVHAAVEDVLNGVEVRIDSKYHNKTLDQMQELTLEECDAILSFIKWQEEAKPIKILTEATLISDKHNCAGTLDFLYRVEGEDANTIHLMDFKISKMVWKSYELQVSAYKQLVLEALVNGDIMVEGLDLTKPIEIICEVLLLGYSRNKAGFKLNVIPDKFDLFLSARSIWAEENDGTSPSKKDYPIVLSPGVIPQVKITEEPIAPTKKVAKTK